MKTKLDQIEKALEYCTDKNSHECKDYTCGFDGKSCLSIKAQEALTALKEIKEGLEATSVTCDISREALEKVAKDIHYK